MQTIKDENIEKKLPRSIVGEQTGIEHVVSKYRAKQFEEGKIKCINYYLEKESDRQYLREWLIDSGCINIIISPEKQTLGIDFEAIYHDGTVESFDVKTNGVYDSRCCTFQLFRYPDGSYNYWGNSQAKYIVQHMQENGACYVFNKNGLMRLVNDCIRPYWFCEESGWTILHDERDGQIFKRLLYVRPWALSKLFKAMHGKNPNNLELPKPKEHSSTLIPLSSKAS